MFCQNTSCFAKTLHVLRKHTTLSKSIDFFPFPKKPREIQVKKTSERSLTLARQKTTKNQLLSDRLVIYCDAPVYKARMYVTEELFLIEKNSFPGNLFLTIPSKDSGQ
jgi:hypothetical protein